MGPTKKLAIVLSSSKVSGTKYGGTDAFFFGHFRGLGFLLHKPVFIQLNIGEDIDMN